ncbi:MAG: oligosaccharide flippase family protein [Armatimonadetes bacterium]|nr:oligosaccharide flippase family protein [Armatimonadota bacterium]
MATEIAAVERALAGAATDEVTKASRRVGINAVWLIGQPLLINALSIPVLAYATRTLGEVNYGRFVLGSSAAILMAGLCSLGTRTVAVRAMAADRAGAARYLGQLLVVRALAGGLGVLAAVLLVQLPGTEFSPAARAVLYAALAWQFLWTISATVGDYFQAHEKMHLLAKSQLYAGVLVNVFTVLFLAWGWGLLGYCAAYLLGGVVCLITTLWYLRQLAWPVLGFSWHFARELLVAAAPFMLAVVVDAIGSRADIFAVTRFTGEAGAGIYGAAMVLITRVMIIPEGIAASLFPALSAVASARKDLAVILLRRYTLGMLLITVPLGIFTSILAPAIVRILYGGRFDASIGVLQVGIWMVPLLGVSYVCGAALNAAHLERITVRTSIYGNVACLLSLLVLTPGLGLPGAVISVILREAVTAAIRVVATPMHFPGCFDLSQLSRAALVLVFVSGLASLAARAPWGGEIFWVLLVALGVYPFLLWRYRLLHPRQMLSLLRPLKSSV